MAITAGNQRARSNGIVVLDGGMGGEIQRRIPGAGHGVWSARALLEQPETVVDIHRDYIVVGATVITTNTYSTIPSYLGKAGLAERYVELTTLAARLARQAADAADSTVLVAGSLPPLSESYRADLVPPAEEAAPIYENMVAAMNDHVDLYLCETMSTAAEARHASSAALASGKPVYVSWTLDETPGQGLRSGESVATAFAELDGLAIDAYLFNCTHPESIETALAELLTLTDKPIGCYPNRLNRVPEGWTLDNEIDTGLRPDLPGNTTSPPCSAASTSAPPSSAAAAASAPPTSAHWWPNWEQSPHHAEAGRMGRCPSIYQCIVNKPLKLR